MIAPVERPAAASARRRRRPRSGDAIDDAYIRLRDLIVSGSLAPGSRIVETDLSNRLGLSRTPVRSALQRLHQEGYLYAEDGRKQSRLSVSPLTREDGQELFEILAQIEGLAARRTAELPEGERDDVIATLRHTNDELAAAVDAGISPEKIYDLHTRFHGIVVDATRAPRLIRLHGTFKPQAERYRRLYSRARAVDTRTSVDEHVEIIDRLAAGDAAGAERAVRENWEKSARRLARLIEQEGERGHW